jgi:site-specific recombinase XerD
MTPLAPHVAVYLQERLPVETGASEHTRDSYAHAFRLLFEFAAARRRTTPSALHFEHLDAPMILAFLKHLETVRRNSPRSRNARLAAIKAFMRFMEHRLPSALDQIRSVLAIPVKRVETKLIPHLDLDEMKAVLASPDPSTLDGVRDRAMLHVAFATGARVSELVGLRIDDVTFQPRPCLSIDGKGRRHRVLPLSNETVSAVRAWLRVRPETGVRELFLSARGRPLTRDGFAYVLDKHVERAKRTAPSIAQKRVSPHVLRHTCAMFTLYATRDIRKVSLWLGHSTIQTTEVYTHADLTEKLEAVEAVLPPVLRRGRFRPSDRLIALLKAPYATPSEKRSRSNE